MSESPEPRRGHSESPRKRYLKRKTVFKRLQKGVFHRLRDKGKSTSTYSNDSRRRSYRSSHRDTESCNQSSRSRETEFSFEKHHNKNASSQRTKALLKSEDPFTPRIRYFEFPKIQMPSHIKTYDKNEDLKDHLKIFQAAAKTERWAMPTWCHMFNSKLTGNARVWFDDVLKEFIDSYDDLKEALLENYLQQKKCIKDPVEIHNIKQREGESTKEFVRRGNLRKGKTAGNTDGEEDGTEGLMIIEAEIRGHFVHRMYVDRGSSFKILYEHCFNRFRLEVRSQMIHATTPLFWFSGEIIWSLGQILLLEKIGDEEHSTSAWMNFMIVRSPSPYNGIIGRPRVKRFQAVPSIAHGMLKFLMTDETVTLRSSRIILLECMMFSGPRAQQPVIDQVTKEKIQVAIHQNIRNETIAIGFTLTEEGRKELCGLLRHQPIKQMLSNPEIAERLLKWRFELEEHNSHYRPRTSVKGQTLANFIIERPEDDPPDTPMEDKEELSDP
nr:reverse transcriptase domain-containing protein [Tanacetum cinerariifolium]GEW36751.1 reverse transcriptase domain-containing protein [Tanacetum cinerariifolium]